VRVTLTGGEIEQSGNSPSSNRRVFVKQGLRGRSILGEIRYTAKKNLRVFGIGSFVDFVELLEDRGTQKLRFMPVPQGFLEFWNFV
jgi:hypothetical protein